MRFWWTQSKATNQVDFDSFYAVYAPKLWGIILLANLPIPQSEQILINTLRKAWQQVGPSWPDKHYMLSRLLGLACQQGLPEEGLLDRWKADN